MSAINFAGKVALITGASSGIGAATAELFAKCGATLIVTGRTMANLRKTMENCRKVAPKIKALEVVADVTKERDIESLVERSIKEFGKLDILVNNAGILQTGTIQTTSLAQYDHLMNTNVRSIYHLTMLCVPYLIKTEGSIVNVSSVNGLRSFAGVLAYNISKSALDQFTRCVALELAPKKVRVNSVNPGVVVTELQKRGGLDDVAYAKFLERTKETHALGRPGQPQEIAEAIAFLACNQHSAFITGVNLPVDGGRHAMCPR